VPKSDDDKRRRQERPSEPQPPSVTKTTDVALTLAGSSPTAEAEAQRFGLSKKAFKRAVGLLLKEARVSFDGEGNLVLPRTRRIVG